MSKEYKINFDDYSFMDTEGTYLGILDFKLSGKKQNIIAYFTLENGKKIIAVAYKDNDYHGLNDVELDETVRLTFVKSQSGRIRLSEVGNI